MSKNRLVTCPGCDRPFAEGRSLSQHLIRNPFCKLHIHSTPQTSTAPSSFLTGCPRAPLMATERHTIGTPSNHRTDSDLVGDIATGDEFEVPPDDISVDSQCLPMNHQNVVSFPVAFTSSAYHEVQLLKLMHDIGAPNYAFQSFMEWGRKGALDNYNFRPYPQRYESQIKHLTELVGMKDCRPTTIPVMLEPDNLTLDVVVFPFATMLSLLLNCPMLNKLENLVVNPLDRFARFQSPDGLLDEVNSGQWYQDTYDKAIHNPDTDFLAPIIFTMDKTVISEASHLSVYVILFTTSIFNRSVCIYFLCCLYLNAVVHPRL